jgi:transposase
MPGPLPIELRERAVQAYERGGESYETVAATFSVATRALQRWVKRRRETGSVAPLPRGGGNSSPVDVAVLEAVINDSRDATTWELAAQYNGRVSRDARVHRSSIVRALRRAGYVFKKNGFVRQNKTAPTFA